MSNLEQDVIERETNTLLKTIDERQVDFSRVYYYFLVVLAGVGMFHELDAGSYIGINNEWFLVMFQMGLFVLGLTIFYSGITVFVNTRSVRYIWKSFSGRTPTVQALNVIFGTFSFVALLNFFVNPSLASLGIVLIFVGLIIEVSITSHYKHLIDNVYSGDVEKASEEIVNRMASLSE